MIQGKNCPTLFLRTWHMTSQPYGEHWFHLQKQRPVSVENFVGRLERWPYKCKSRLSRCHPAGFVVVYMIALQPVRSIMAHDQNRIHFDSGPDACAASTNKVV